MKKILFLLLLGAALSARADEPFVGMYRQDDADITARLLLLDKQRFCFAISAGGIDMHTGGSWQKMDGQNGSIRLRLTEKHLGLPALVMVANPEMDAKTLAKTLAETQQMFGKEKRVVFLVPLVLQDAIDINPALAFSTKADWPGEGAFKPLFAEGQGIERNVKVPMPDNTRYVFVRSEDGSQIFRFAVGQSQYVRLNPNEQAMRETLDFELAFDRKTRRLTHLKNGTLHHLGQPEKLSPQAQENAWAQCEPKIPREMVRTVRGTERTLLVPDVLPQR
ncbi:hypothetical protein [Kingella denitrificans]|uniref:hypothetical protein n=1 Tax=Kingella denitrificans TaxID=502 RepID=UPI0028D3B472|nr:hypothetical protein [Kingella denitrificans]